MDGVGIATKKKMMSGKGRGGDGTVLVAATEARRISSLRTSSKLCALEPAESVVTAWNSSLSDCRHCKRCGLPLKEIAPG